MAFGEIPGNARIKKIIQTALQKEMLPNSLLFSGPEGVGKLETALEVAKALNCRQMKGDACGLCESCRAIAAGNFPDVLIQQPENHVLRVDPTRLLKRMAYLKPMSGGKRVFIVVEAEKMNPEAANTLLKVLEEPPDFSYILLVTSNPHLILPTIISRCQVLKFVPVSQADILRELKSKGYPDDQAKGIAMVAQGNLKRALTMDWDEVRNQREQTWGILTSMFSRDDLTFVMKSLAFKRRKEFGDEFKLILERLSGFCRDLMLMKEGGDAGFLLNPDYAEKLEALGLHLTAEQAREGLERIDRMLHYHNNHVNIDLLASSLCVSLMGESYV